jgi:protease I
MDIDDKAIAIVATDLFEETELTKPKAALEAAGARVRIIAPHGGRLQAVRHERKTIVVPVDQTLQAANPEDYDAVLIPGGTLNTDALRTNVSAQEFVRSIEEAGKPLGVICHGPWLLISAGLVQGRRLTSYHTMADDLRNAGAEWVDEEVVIDDNWVSSRRPGDIAAFNKAFIKLLSEQA